MHAPISMILFTTLAGMAQGLLLALVGLDVAAAWGLSTLPDAMRYVGAACVLVLGTIGLAAATFHLGHPLRAWRSAAMWRTSWLSREVIALPLFLALSFAWALSHWGGKPGLSLALGLAAAFMALVLFVCTGMIYGAVKAIREWATPMTPLNFALLGSASGCVLASALASAWAPEAVKALSMLSLGLLLIGGACRIATAWRNYHLVPKTTLQTAIGVRHPRIVQSSQGMMAGTFNSREFFHGRSPEFVMRMRWAALGLGCLLPALGLLLTHSLPGLACVSALLWLGLLAERWLFFAEARHPQNLYQQRIG
jgi:sulfite dehydrogenase (quinone) subunit SoeC